MELGRPGGGFRAGRGSQRAVSYIQFYGKLSVKNPASRGQVNLDIFKSSTGLKCLSRGRRDEFTNFMEISFLEGETAGELL